MALVASGFCVSIRVISVLVHSSLLHCVLKPWPLVPEERTMYKHGSGGSCASFVREPTTFMGTGQWDLSGKSPQSS